MTYLIWILYYNIHGILVTVTSYYSWVPIPSYDFLSISLYLPPPPSISVSVTPSFLQPPLPQHTPLLSLAVYPFCYTHPASLSNRLKSQQIFSHSLSFSNTQFLWFNFSGYIQRLCIAVNTLGTETNGFLSMYCIKWSTTSCFKAYIIERSLYVKFQ